MARFRLSCQGAYNFCNTSFFCSFDHSQDESDNPLIDLEFNRDGQLYVKSQLLDYQLRGDTFSDISVFNFFTNSYDSRKQNDDPNSNPEIEVHANSSPSRKRKRKGCPPNPKYRYKDNHPCSNSTLCVVRSDNHRNVTYFLGRWFPN